jgi:hypothetical protein
MARQKSQSAENISSSDGSGNELIAQLLKKIEDLEKKVNQGQTNIEDQNEFNKNKINMDDAIKVISLCPYMLNLVTEKNGQGQGRVYSFAHFGEVKRIVFSDLNKIVESNRHFLEQGFFYIMDQRCIRYFGIEETYENILTKESIETILEGKSNDVVSLFKSANDTQKELIIDLIIKKMLNDPESVDLNLIDKISRASGVKIQEEAEKARDYVDSLNPTEEKEED